MWMLCSHSNFNLWGNLSSSFPQLSNLPIPRFRLKCQRHGLSYTNVDKLMKCEQLLGNWRGSKVTEGRAGDWGGGFSCRVPKIDTLSQLAARAAMPLARLLMNCRCRQRPNPKRFKAEGVGKGHIDGMARRGNCCLDICLCKSKI